MITFSVKKSQKRQAFEINLNEFSDLIENRI